MVDRSPGEPVNPGNVPAAQGLPYDVILVPSHTVAVGNGCYHMDTPTVIPVPLQHAQYQSIDVPFQKKTIDYKP